MCNEIIPKYKGVLSTADIVSFLVTYIINDEAEKSYGGYPFDLEESFEDNGDIYHALTVGWIRDDEYTIQTFFCKEEKNQNDKPTIHSRT